jgi:hypothetical protein
MAIKVPVYQRQARVQAPQISAPKVSQPIAAASGVNVSEAIARFGEKMGDVSAALTKHMVAKQEREEEREVLQTDTAFRKEMQNKLYDKETDENGRPKGILLREKAWAKDATPEFDQGFTEARERYLGAAKTDRQRDMLSKLLDNHYESLRDNVIRHEASQDREAFKDSYDAAINTRIQSAAMHRDSATLLRDMDEAAAVQSVGHKRLGLQGEAAEFDRKQLHAKMLKTAFDANLERDWKAADALVEASKDRIPENAYAELKKTIEGKQIHEQVKSTWGQVGSYRMADGTSDLPRMMKTIDGMQVPDDRKEKLKNEIKAKALEEDQFRKRAEGAQTHGFTNEVLLARKKGVRLEQVLEQAVPKYGGDPVRRNELSEIAKKLYTTDIKTDPQAYYQVWESIKSGDPNGQTLVKQAFAENKISGSDMVELLKLTHSEAHREDEYMKGQVIDSVKDLARQSYGNSKSGKQKQNGFLYTVLVRSRGKSPEETQKIAADLLKSDDSSGWFWKDDQWVAEKKGIEANNAAMGLLHQDLGENVTSALGGPAKIDQSVKALGLSYDELKKGSPANNAIESLRKNGKAVNKKNINAVLSRYKDGVIQ